MTTLKELVIEKYAQAKANNDIIIFEATLSQKEVLGVPFQINYVPTLAKKPDNKDDIESSNSEEPPFNPFLHPPSALIVKEFDHHRILLNKFCVMPHHLLIVTNEYQPQTQPLFPPDLLIAWKTLKTAYEPDLGMVFYNSGPNSGASQAHKHLQVIPLGGEGTHPPLQALINKIDNPKAGEIYTLDALPFTHVVTPLDQLFLKGSVDEAVEDYLGQMFFGLLDAMFQQVRFANDQRPGNTKPSYNFVMTQQFMLLVPRQQEDAVINQDVHISVNSMGFAGYLLAKTQDEFDVLQEPSNIVDLLCQAGIPVAENQPSEQTELLSAEEKN